MITDAQTAAEIIKEKAAEGPVEWWTPMWHCGPRRSVCHYRLVSFIGVDPSRHMYAEGGPWVKVTTIYGEREYDTEHSLCDMTNNAHGICFTEEEALRVAYYRAWLHENDPELSERLVDEAKWWRRWDREDLGWDV